MLHQMLYEYFWFNYHCIGTDRSQAISEFYRRRGEEERPFVEEHPMRSRVVPATATPDPW